MEAEEKTEESDWSGDEIWIWWKPTGFEKAKQIKNVRRVDLQGTCKVMLL